MRFTLAVSLVALPGCLCICDPLPSEPTALADWPSPTLIVNVDGEFGLGIGLAPQPDGSDACPTLRDDARAFVGDASSNELRRGGVSCGGNIPPLYANSCSPPGLSVPIDDAIGGSARIDVGFDDDSATLSATIRRPPVNPQLAPLASPVVVAPGGELRLQANTTLDDPLITFVARFGGAVAATRLESADIIVVTAPAAALAGPAAIDLDVTELFAAEACTAAACDVSGTVLWSARVDAVVE